MRPIILTTLCIILLTTFLFSNQLANTQVRLTETEVVYTDVEAPRSGGTKYPDLAGHADRVHLAANPGERISYWSKRDSAGAWPNRQILGNAEGQADFASGSVAVGSDGTVIVGWIDRSSGAIYMRRRLPGATDFEAQKRIGSADNFGVFVDVAITPSGTIFAVWNAADRMRYRLSRDGGNTWTGARIVSDTKAAGKPSVTAGLNGSVLVAHYGDGIIYGSRWNGSGFTTDVIARPPTSSDFFADPSGIIAPNGSMYIAWRNVRDGQVLYVERRPTDSNWRPRSLLTSGGETSGVVSIVSDSQNNLHIFWFNNRAGGADIYHAFKPAAENWEPITRINIRGGFNLSGAATLTDRAYGHVVYEVFGGGDPVVQYSLVATDAGPPPTPTPAPVPTGSLQINDGAATTGRRDITVEITANNADQYRLSNDGTTFSEYADIPDDGLVSWELEAAPSGSTACINRTVFGQLRSSANPSQESAVLEAAIAFDPGIDATGSIRNPFLTRNPAVFIQGDGVRLLENGSDGARDGDPRYTRIPGYFLEVRGLSGECSGLESLTVNTSPGTVFGFDENNYLGVALAFPQVTTDDPVISVQATMTDTVKYSQDFEQTIYYDPEPPLVTSGTPKVVDDLGQTITNTNYIIVTLSFEDIGVVDNLYGKNGEDFPFWGVWIANSLTDLDPNDPEDGDALNALEWATVPLNDITANGETYTFSIPWSLFSGIPRDQWQGGVPYYTYARILDGAGNASTTTLKYEVALSTDFQLPQTNLPLVTR